MIIHSVPRVMTTPAMHVFRNFTTRRPVPNRMLRQSKPNVGSYAWMPNAPTNIRTQPWERGATFVAVGRSGTGMVGTPNNALETNAGALIGQETGFSLTNDKRVAREQHRGGGGGGIFRTTIQQRSAMGIRH